MTHPSIDRVRQHAEEESSLNMMYYLAVMKVDSSQSDSSLLADDEATWDVID